MTEAMMEAGLTNYLPWSMTQSVVSAPIESIRKHFPDASALIAEQAPHRPSSKKSITMFYAVVVMGALLTCGLLLLALFYSWPSSPHR